MEGESVNLERPERNLLNDPMGAIEAMAQVEGPLWLAKQDAITRETVSDGEYDASIANALERVQVGKSTTVNGREGVHRWFVEGDGSISFSETHAQPEFVQKARELGFAIVP